ncbi:probable RNA-binding protein EIF1AD [Erpetoichthys calabaricus]|uniref:Probable RNA-binding protein EIF1AD n=2 Tax=Polypteridae TaxID=8289 RepID=A0A8C4RIX2_ERPCA|nr:probable RNA-binding protein EIF1AD [Erpetoichthys calabaricus]
MSQATKRKHVVKEVMGDYVIPTQQQQIVRVLGTPGNNLHEVETAKGERFLVSMPTKFRKNIWIKRGDFLIVDPIEEGDKVKAEISFILYKDHIRHLIKEGAWPEGFSENLQNGTSQNGHKQVDNARASSEDDVQTDDAESEPDDSDLFVNTNRINYEYSDSEEDSNEEDTEDEEERQEEEAK